MNSKKDTRFSDLYDIIGSSDATKKQREAAWQKLLLIENNFGFSIIIAAKFSWREFSDEYKEKAWQEMIKRKVKDDEINLHYLAVNAPETWSKRARVLEEKLLEKKNQR